MVVVGVVVVVVELVVVVDGGGVVVVVARVVVVVLGTVVEVVLETDAARTRVVVVVGWVVDVDVELVDVVLDDVVEEDGGTSAGTSDCAPAWRSVDAAAGDESVARSRERLASTVRTTTGVKTIVRTRAIFSDRGTPDPSPPARVAGQYCLFLALFNTPTGFHFPGSEWILRPGDAVKGCGLQLLSRPAMGAGLRPG